MEITKGTVEGFPKFFRVAKQITPCRDRIILPFSQFSPFQFLNSKMQGIAQALFLFIIHGELFELSADRNKPVIFRSIGTECISGFTETVQKTEVAFLIKKTEPVILPVDIYKLGSQFTKLRGCHRNTAHPGG